MASSLQHVVTGKARLSYCNLFTPESGQPGEEPKYSTTILVPKSDIATKQRIDIAIQEAKQAGVKDKWRGVMPPVCAIPINDGDGVRPSDGQPYGEECKGHWVFTARSKQRPTIWDYNRSPIIDQSEVFSGIYAHVSIDFFPYENSGKKGIGCSLGNVMKIEDGEPLGSRVSAADDFGTMPGTPIAQPQFAPQTPPQYQQPPMGYGQIPQQPALPAGYGQMPQQPIQPAQVYPQQPMQPAYPQPAYPQQPYAPQIDPITGLPAGGVMGI